MRKAKEVMAHPGASHSSDIFVDETRWASLPAALAPCFQGAAHGQGDREGKEEEEEKDEEVEKEASELSRVKPATLGLCLCPAAS